MTSERIEAYGGIEFPREVLERAANSVRLGDIPLHVEHDLSRPIRTRNPDAFVKARDDGIFELHTTFEIHGDDLHLLESRSAMSVMLTVPVPRAARYVEPVDPEMRIGADHAWFSDEVLIEAETSLSAAGVAPARILTERAYQFSFTPDPQIYLTIGFGLFVILGSSGIWTAVSKLLHGRETPRGGDPESPTVINITVVDGSNSIRGIIQADGERVARRAVNELGTLGDRLYAQSNRSEPPAPSPLSNGQSSSVQWDDPNSRWVPPA